MKNIMFLLVLFLVGCQSTLPKVAVVPDPIPENCAIMCRTPCSTGPTSGDLNIKPTDKNAYDLLMEQVVIPLRKVNASCELSRVACTQCLDRLKAAGLTK